MTLRRRSFDDESAIEAAVDHLLRQQELLDDDAVTPTAAAATTATAVAVEDTFLVASPNSRTAIFNAADITTNEVDDHVEIQAALDGHTFNPPVSSVDVNTRVVMAAGLYKIDGTMTMPEASSLVGVGNSSQFEALTTGAEFVVDDYCELGNFLVQFGPGP